MSSPRAISIVGGGLAGLSLGCALRRSGIPTTIFEAGDYPRHRVCGEFIAGLRDRTIAQLGLADVLADALPCQSVRWFRAGRLIRRQTLSRPARAISRYSLDQRMAEAFVAAGGELRTHSRISSSTTEEGRVFSSGRVRRESEWIGLKVHARGLVLESDLEFHLGDRCYVGLCALPDGSINICGLFQVRSGVSTSRTSALFSYLDAVGLGSLAAKLRSADCDEASFSAVAGFSFDLPANDDGADSPLSLGDAYAMIPPFTGNGMAIAFQSAETALPHLIAWAKGETSWPQTMRVTKEALQKRFGRRFFLASKLHPFLFHPPRQAVFNLVNRARLLPLEVISSAIHAH
ncbi:MAG TPA: NAD(P)-binding protein [Opitutaceae bacterium]|nr:NAD(P)-binding protein [Opitutaceae bacterium]